MSTTTTTTRTPAAGWQERIAAAAQSKTGKPGPSTRDLQAFFDVYDGFEAYLVAAATQWCIEHGDGAVRWCPAGSHDRCPAERYGVCQVNWEETTADQVAVEVYRSHYDYRNYSTETLYIPIGDLFPEFGQVRSLIRALSS